MNEEASGSRAYEEYVGAWLKENTTRGEIEEAAASAVAAVALAGYAGSFEEFVRDSGGFAAGMFATREEFEKAGLGQDALEASGRRNENEVFQREN